MVHSVVAVLSFAPLHFAQVERSLRSLHFTVAKLSYIAPWYCIVVGALYHCIHYLPMWVCTFCTGKIPVICGFGLHSLINLHMIVGYSASKVVQLQCTYVLYITGNSGMQSVVSLVTLINHGLLHLLCTPPIANSVLF